MLDMRDWREFRLGDLIETMYKATAYTQESLLFVSSDCDDAMPFVTRTEANNGCVAFVSKNGLEHIEAGNALIVGDTTSTCFYQRDRFVAGDHIVVCRASWLNENTALFVKTLLQRERFRYSYGRAFVMDMIKETKILLPSTQERRPDWIAIENYMNSLKTKRENSGSALNELINTCNASRSARVETKDWREFELTKLFSRFEVGKAHTGDLEDGDDCLYLGAKKDDNSVMRNCARNEGIMHKGNCIVFICNGEGSVGYVNYMNRDFIATTDLVMGYSKKLNQYSGAFLVGVLDLERPKYSFGRKWKTHLKDTRIRLPATPLGEPDWTYMENYIRSLPYGDRI